MSKASTIRERKRVGKEEKEKERERERNVSLSEETIILSDQVPRLLGNIGVERSTLHSAKLPRGGRQPIAKWKRESLGEELPRKR